jgi:hypothetical protein
MVGLLLNGFGRFGLTLGRHQSIYSQEVVDFASENTEEDNLQLKTIQAYKIIRNGQHEHRLVTSIHIEETTPTSLMEFGRRSDFSTAFPSRNRLRMQLPKGTPVTETPVI